MKEPLGGMGGELDEPVSRYVSKVSVEVPYDEPVSNAARKMQMVGSTEAVVIREGAPVGILTERDIVYQVVAEGLDPNSTKVVDVMSSPLESVEEDVKVRDAIIKMNELGCRRLGVMKGGKLVGLLVQKSLVTGAVGEHIPLAELARSGHLECPYCGKEFQASKALSEHVAGEHLGSGNVRR